VQKGSRRLTGWCNATFAWLAAAETGAFAAGCGIATTFMCHFSDTHSQRACAENC